MKIVDSKTGKEEDGQLKKDVANAIVKSFGWSFFLASLLKLVHDIFIFEKYFLIFCALIFFF